MNSAGDGILGNMPKLLRKLQCGPLLNQDPLPSEVKGKGIYMFYENGQRLYVGRSDGLRNRILLHSRPSSIRAQAPLAGILAKNKGHPDQFFSDQKERVKKMRVRVVEVTDDYEQAIFEVCAALILNTCYNEFKNH
jgi:hypothetical protein